MMLKPVVVVALLINIVVTSKNVTRQDVLKILINESLYDPRISPNFDYDTATNVSIQIYFINIHSLSELNMDYSADIFLRQSWQDPRLAFNHLSKHNRLELGQKMIDKVWVPDTIFANEKEAYFHEVTVPNKLMHLYPNGTVFYSARIGIKMNCHMNLEKFPLDAQFCHLKLESYGYSTQNLVFYWKAINPVDIRDRIKLSQFIIDPDVRVSDCHRDYGEAGQFACLEAGFHIVRNRGYYVIQVFIPSILVVILSWVSFWIDIDATPARVSLGVLTVLTMTTQTSGLRAQLPRVSYVKAIDVWMSTCLVFVFGALVEYSYANVLLRKGKQSPCNNKQTEKQFLNDDNKQKSCKMCSPAMTLRARYVDKISRVAFPTAFAVFNVVFWTYYLCI